jgi:hypothetical protein
LVNPKEGKIEKTEEILKRLASQKPYGEWLEKHLKRLKDFVKGQAIDIEEDKELIRKQVAFGYYAGGDKECSFLHGGGGKGADVLYGRRYAHTTTF